MTNNTDEKLAVLHKIENEFEKSKGEAYILLGRLEAFNFSKRFLEFSELKTIERIKETKAYRDLWVTDKKTGERKKINTLKEYCECLGISYDTVNNHLNYLQNLGEPLYRESQRLGVSNREMRRLIKLPPEAITEMTEQGYSEDDDKNRLLAMLSDYELKYEKQAEELKETKQQLEETRENYYAQERFIQNKNDHIDRISSDLAKAQRLIETMTPDEEGAKLREEVDLIAYGIKAAIIAQLKPAFEQLEKHQEKTNIDHQQFMTGLVADLRLELNQIQSYFNLNDITDGDNTPEWMRDDKEPVDYSEEMARLFGEK